MDLGKLLLSPPVAFIILLVLGVILLAVFSLVSFVNKNQTAGHKKPYACGEDVTKHRLQPDYTDFFPFVFFFTIMHVIALFIATVPKGSLMTLGIAVIYLLGAVIGLYVLYRN